MTDDLFVPLTPSNPGAGLKRCRRHVWEWAPVRDMLVCCRCGRPRDEARARTNTNNRKRGNRTSADLAKFLGGRNVEALKLEWDVEARGCHVQSKREAAPMGLARAVRLVEYMPYRHDVLRAVFWVGAGQRITSGDIYASLNEWVTWHGWTFPASAALLNVGGPALIRMDPTTFRDLHIGTPEAP